MSRRNKPTSPAALKRDVMELNKAAKSMLAVQAENLQAFIVSKPEQTPKEQSMVETVINDIAYYNDKIKEIESSHGKLDDHRLDRLAVSLEIGTKYIEIIDNAQHTITTLIADLSTSVEAHIDEAIKKTIGATP